MNITSSVVSNVAVWNVCHNGDNAVRESNKGWNVLFIGRPPPTEVVRHSQQKGDCPKDISPIPRTGLGGNKQEKTGAHFLAHIICMR